MSHIPTGFSPITPFLHLEDAPAFIAFAQKAFGAEVLMDHRDSERVVHAELRLFGSVIELSDSTDTWPAMNSALHCYVPDPDAVYARAIEAGATSLFEPADMDYGERSGGVKDPFGNCWYLGCVTDMAKRTGAM